MSDLQATLFDIRPLTRPSYEEDMTLRQRWWAFHCANPHIYDTLRRMAFALQERGYKRASISLLWERLRWESYVQTQGAGEYKLSNSHRAFYARFLMAREPRLEGFFEIRTQPSEEQEGDR